jgi:hypothetical protein
MYAKAKAVAQIRKCRQAMRRLGASFPWKRAIKTGFSAEDVKIGYI